MLAGMKRILSVLAVIVISACTALTTPQEQQGYQRYMCDKGWTIQVEHNPQDIGGNTMIPWHDDNVRVTVNGQPFEMYSVAAASGEKYATEQGLTPDAGLIWWDKSNEGVLQAMVLDHTVDPAHYPVIVRCERLHITGKV